MVQNQSKRGSKRVSKKGSQKNTKNDDFQDPCMWLKYSKYMQNRWFSCSGLGSLWGLILGSFWEPKWRPKAWKSGSKKSFKNRSKKWSIFGRFWGPIGDPFGARKGEIRGLKSDLCSSRVPGGVQGSILIRFLMILGPILWWFWMYFRHLGIPGFMCLTCSLRGFDTSWWTSRSCFHPFGYCFWVGFVLSLSWFFTCLLLLKFLLFEGLLTVLVRWWGLSTSWF